MVIETSSTEGNLDDGRHPDRPRQGTADRHLDVAEAASRARGAVTRRQAGTLEPDRAPYLPLHAPTDEIAADTWAWADRIAERAVALGDVVGFAVDARPGTVAAVARQFPTGRVTDQEAIAELIRLMERVAAAVRYSLGDLEQADPVGRNLTLEILEGLDKYRWMLCAQTL